MRSFRRRRAQSSQKRLLVHGCQCSRRIFLPQSEQKFGRYIWRVSSTLCEMVEDTGSLVTSPDRKFNLWYWIQPRSEDCAWFAALAEIFALGPILPSACSDAARSWWNGNKATCRRFHTSDVNAETGGGGKALFAKFRKPQAYSKSENLHE